MLINRCRHCVGWWWCARCSCFLPAANEDFGQSCSKKIWSPWSQQHVFILASWVHWPCYESDIPWFIWYFTNILKTLLWHTRLSIWSIGSVSFPSPRFLKSVCLSINHNSLSSGHFLAGNELQEIPESIGELARLVLLDVQSNQLKRLPEALGCLTNLATLNIQKNSIEELPWTIGLCTSLVELNADFNKLKALPEAMGHLVSLQRISVHLNSLRSLPTTISLLTNLTQLDVHFNQLETVPESLCSLPNLTNLDLSSNFTELKELPKSIGRLQSLREVDISFNHITELPASFVLLTGLQKLTLDGNPLRMPPLQIAQQGKEVHRIPFLDLSQALYLNCLQLWNLKLQSSFLAAANYRKDVNVLQAIFNYMNDMLQHLEAEEKVRSRKMGMASMMTVFKKNKIANFRVKDDPDLSIKAWCAPWLIKASQTRHFPKANLFILVGRSLCSNFFIMQTKNHTP